MFLILTDKGLNKQIRLLTQKPTHPCNYNKIFFCRYSGKEYNHLDIEEYSWTTF